MFYFLEPVVLLVRLGRNSTGIIVFTQPRAVNLFHVFSDRGDRISHENGNGHSFHHGESEEEPEACRPIIIAVRPPMRFFDTGLNGGYNRSTGDRSKLKTARKDCSDCARHFWRSHCE